jgi:peroxiredoxin
MIKRAITAFAVLGLATAAFAVEVGKPAPDFEAKDINGKTHKLSDYKGKIVVIESYNLDCPLCKNHFKNGDMQALQKEVTDKGGIWLMVNSVNPDHSNYRTAEKAQVEWKEQKINATAWLDDSSGTIGKMYGMRTTPHMYIVDKDGTLVYNGAIDDKPDATHDPKTARNYVRETFGKMAAGEKVTPFETRAYGCSVKYVGVR